MKLVEFLTEVVSDRTARERFCANPREAIRDADLSPEAQAAIKSGNPWHVAYVICVGEAPPSRKFDPID